MFHKMLQIAIVGGIAILVAPYSIAQSHFGADLDGGKEIPAVSSSGTGQFTATLQANDTEIAWEIDFSGLSGPPTQAHIHFGQTFASGGVVYWICGSGATPGPAGTAACPGGNSGSLTGFIRSAGITAVTAQGIPANDFAKVLEAIRDGDAYANIHTAQSPAGEIRGQLKPGNGKGNGKGNGNGKDKDKPKD